MRFQKTKHVLLATLAALLLAKPAYADDSVSATEKPAEPFAFGDFTWVPGGYAPTENPLATKYFTPEIRIDNVYHYDFNQPKDHTISGSSEEFRSGEFQTTQIGVGGDLSYNNVGVRLMTQFGMYSTTTPRNDSSSTRGQWQTDNAYRYISEAYVTYHLNEMHGVNIQTGIFMSYVGLWSYYNFDNWTYQPSYVSSNTPWFFNGMRIQTYPTDRLKIEYWIVNGWQSYNAFNEQPGLGMQVLYRPNETLSVLGNQYVGADTLNTPGRIRYHTDDSIMKKYFEDQSQLLGKAAFSLTVDGGCEEGGGVHCGDQYFLGFMAYNRLWFDHDRYGLTVGGGYITNKGRYLVLVPPINGATAATGDQSGAYTANPGDTFDAWDMQITGDYMPTRNLTFRLEYTYRWASIPYFTGPGGLTPPSGNQGAPGSAVAGFTPDLVKDENIVSLAMMARF